MSPARHVQPVATSSPSIGSPMWAKPSSGRNMLAPSTSGPGFGTGVVGGYSNPPETEIPLPVGEDVLALQVRVHAAGSI